MGTIGTLIRNKLYALLNNNNMHLHPTFFTVQFNCLMLFTNLKVSPTIRALYDDDRMQYLAVLCFSVPSSSLSTTHIN